MKITKLSTKEIEELQPTEVSNAAEKGYILGGFEVPGEIDHAALSAFAKANYGPGADIYGEGNDRDECVHFAVYLLSAFSA